jgi:hypothetical protein
MTINGNLETGTNMGERNGGRSRIRTCDPLIKSSHSGKQVDDAAS